MKIELDHNRTLVIDLTTDAARGNSAANMNVDDQATVVYHGGLHSSVRMTDLRMEVIMDPERGHWDDAGWARTRAFQKVLEAMCPGDLFMICNLLHEAGHHAGALSAKREIRNALGIED